MHFRRFGGDNRDQGKGFVFHHLSGVLRNFHVDPMLTDEDLPAGFARDAFIEAYRRFLRLAEGHQIVNAQVNYNGSAPDSYFSPHFGGDYDLFLDPDTGVGQRGPGHVPSRIIAKLVPVGSDRVLLVYVSSNRNDATWRWLLDQVPRWGDGNLQAFVCDLGGNGILFVSNKGNDRLNCMRENLSNVFGPVSEWRVRS